MRNPEPRRYNEPQGLREYRHQYEWCNSVRSAIAVCGAGAQVLG